MSGGQWLIALALGVALVLWVVAGVIDSRGRRALPRVTQEPFDGAHRPPPLTGPWHPAFHLNRGRRVRRTRATYRYPRELS
ncbi:hypothetical protein [Streptomyces sp. SID13726]|uniref:hypothetical protein n=1 Tax=Streptomyces sp. SID13726 TaxID=2706058 RepID=UPI0013B73F94|nr:hypothetical protein [Streptomyces sp. SID13726]NEB00595.1 hypothetical protein [Streptomyces sp. SID13726]